MHMSTVQMILPAAILGAGNLSSAFGISKATASSPVPYDTISPNKSCGPGVRCPPGQCCSGYGWCGTTALYCGPGCQGSYGLCKLAEERCGQEHNGQICSEGRCCSHAGYCGLGVDYCAVPQSCQRKYGRCDSDKRPSGPSTAPELRPKLDHTPYGKIINECTEKGTIALTFDDGPSWNDVELLEVLKAAGASATFFIGGNTNGKGSIDETPLLSNIIQAHDHAGHQLASHTWSHPNMDAITSEQRRLEMYKTERAFANVLSKFPTYMRPPYVNCTQESGCLKDMDDLGYHVIGYQVDSTDWSQPKDLEAMKTAVDIAFKNAGDSMLLIQHDTIRASAVDLTRHILSRVGEKGWRAVTVAECLGNTLESAYRYPKGKKSKGNRLRPFL